MAETRLPYSLVMARYKRGVERIVRKAHLEAPRPHFLFPWSCILRKIASNHCWMSPGLKPKMRKTRSTKLVRERWRVVESSSRVRLGEDSAIIVRHQRKRQRRIFWILSVGKSDVSLATSIRSKAFPSM